MRYFDRFQPRGAWADLRYFLWHEQPYRWVFLILSVMVTVGTLAAFWVDSRFEPEYKRPQIVWVQQWSLDRTDRQIKAQQKIDQAAKDRRLAVEKREMEERQKYFQDIKKKADPWL